MGVGSRVQADGMGGGVEMTLKKVVEARAQHHGLLFKPKPGRTHNGHQIYGYGNISIYVDSLHPRLYAQNTYVGSIKELPFTSKENLSSTHLQRTTQNVRVIFITTKICLIARKQLFVFKLLL